MISLSRRRPAPMLGSFRVIKDSTRIAPGVMNESIQDRTQPHSTCVAHSPEATQRRFTASDGAEIFYRAWLPAGPARAAPLLFHRGHEHSGRWQEMVEDLGLDDVAVFAWDARGHGESPGERGSAVSVARVVQDIDQFVYHITSEYGIPREDMVVLGHSVGAVTAAAWVHDYAPPIRALILATPAFRVKLYVPLAIPLLRLKQKLLGPGYVKSYVKATMLTHDREQAKLYQQDKAVFPQIAVNILLDLYDTSTRLYRGRGRHPHADAHARRRRRLDRQAVGAAKVLRAAVVDAQTLRSAAGHVPCRIPRTRPARGRRQSARLRPRVDRSAAPTPADRRSRPVRLHAKTNTTACRRRDRRGSNSCVSACKRWASSAPGVRLGWEAGFDSGRTLDYVYENEPAGTTPLGRWFDKLYLNSIGWVGIRQRGENLQRHAGRRLSANSTPAIVRRGWSISLRARAVTYWKPCIAWKTFPARPCCETTKRRTCLPRGDWPRSWD